MQGLRLDTGHDGPPHAIRYGLLDQWLGQQVEVFQPAGQFGAQERVALQQVLKTPAGHGRHQPDGVIGGQRTA